MVLIPTGMSLLGGDHSFSSCSTLLLNISSVAFRPTVCQVSLRGVTRISGCDKNQMVEDFWSFHCQLVLGLSLASTVVISCKTALEVPHLLITHAAIGRCDSWFVAYCASHCFFCRLPLLRISLYWEKESGFIWGRVYTQKENKASFRENMGILEIQWFITDNLLLAAGQNKSDS